MIDLEDKEILANTKQVSAGHGGYVKLSYTIPGDDMPITSEGIASGDLKAETLIKWCDSLRGIVKSREKALQKEQDAIKKARKVAELTTCLESWFEASEEEQLSASGYILENVNALEAIAGKDHWAVVKYHRERNPPSATITGEVTGSEQYVTKEEFSQVVAGIESLASMLKELKESK